MWQQVTDAVGTAQRDALWSHPDLVPTAADIDAPEALIARLEAEARGERPEQDEMDLALEDLLRGEERGDKHDDEPGSEPSGPNGAGGPPV